MSEISSLARLTRERRTALRLTQQDVADLAGCSVRFVRAFEGGKPTVQLDKVVAVLEALGLELSAVPRRSA